ncbi:MAG: alpha-L-fucosidase [Terracidiphilus sp.]
MPQWFDRAKFGIFIHWGFTLCPPLRTRMPRRERPTLNGIGITSHADAVVDYKGKCKEIAFGPKLVLR